MAENQQEEDVAAAAVAQNPVAASIKAKEDMSYYHAHKRPQEDLSDAIKLTGEGLCKPDGVEKLDDEHDPRFIKRELQQERVITLHKYLFEDADDKVKIYFEFESAEILKHGEVKIEDVENGLGMDVRVVLGPGIGPDAKPGASAGIVYQFLANHQKFHAKVLQGKSKYRVSSDKKRLSITLFKEDKEEKWPQLLKKVISQHTGWQ